jgi:hypothetical protein
MSKATVQIGMVYSAKVGDSVLPVRIDAPLGHGRYKGLDMHSGNKVKVAATAIRGDGRTAKQWHVEQMAKKGDAPAAASADQKAEGALKEAAKVASKVLGVPVTAVPAGKTATKPAIIPAPRPAGTGKRVGGLDAAATVLAMAREPLNTAEMVKRMLAKGLWKTSGKTPAATIYAAIIREIAVKGGEARFRKTERGKFALAK